jgi:lysophospholipase L1-like esterase
MIDSICVFGDSIMKGVIFDAIKGKYIFLKSSFLNILGKRNSEVKVDNYAKFGCTVTVGKKLIERHADKLPNYTYTALEFGGNDCDFDWKAISENPEALHIAKTPIDEFEVIYSDIIDSVIDTGSTPVLFSLPPLNARRYFSWISKGLNSENILHWLGDEEHIYRWHEMYNIAVLKLASAKNVMLIDIRRAFLETRNYLGLLCEDGIHPNEAGHALISEVIRKRVPTLA